MKQSFPERNCNLIPVWRGVYAGPALSRCNRCSCTGFSSASGAPRHGVWIDCQFLPDTPCAWEFSKNHWCRRRGCRGCKRWVHSVFFEVPKVPDMFICRGCENERFAPLTIRNQCDNPKWVVLKKDTLCEWFFHVSQLFFFIPSFWIAFFWGNKFCTLAQLGFLR